METCRLPIIVYFVRLVRHCSNNECDGGINGSLRCFYGCKNGMVRKKAGFLQPLCSFAEKDNPNPERVDRMRKISQYTVKDVLRLNV